MARHIPFESLEVTARFTKSLGKLSKQAQAQCKRAMRQLLEAPLAPGLRMKPIRPGNVYYEVRINSGDRMIIYPISGTAYLMDVVRHDDIGKWGN